MGIMQRIKTALTTIESGGGSGAEDSTQVTIPAGIFRSVPSGSQEIVFGELDVSGNLDIAGTLYVVNTSVLGTV